MNSGEHNFPDDLLVKKHDSVIMFQYGDVKTGWIDINDSFISKITLDNLNPDRQEEHLIYMLNLKNRFDEGVNLLKHEKYSKAIECFDDAIYYDSNDGEALIYKSHALFGQKHFVKALRYYRRAIKADGDLKDDDYFKDLLDKSNNERDNFPKLKLSIYAGDEFFSKGEFENAIESYDKALVNPSKFKDKILFKLLNKKATAYVKLNDFKNAKECFNESWNVFNNDYACFGLGYCQYRLNLEVNDCFKKPLKINKKLLITKAEILSDLGYIEESKKDYCEFLKNHFTIDGDYKKAMGGVR